MIILAVAIILSLNSSGIINKANEAKNKVDMATVKEQLETIKAEAQLNDSTPNFSKINTGDLPIEINSSTGEVTLKGSVDDKTLEAYMDLFVETTPVSDFNYTESGGKTTITKYKGNAKSVRIPSAINGKPVTEIGEAAFSSCTILTDLAIPKSITVILNDAFEDCTNLTNVIIPDSVTVISQRYVWFLYQFNKHNNTQFCYFYWPAGI